MADREDERAMIADWDENERAAYRCGVADEREACAQLVEQAADQWTADYGWSRPQVAAMRHAAKVIAGKIRRGDTT